MQKSYMKKKQFKRNIKDKKSSLRVKYRYQLVVTLKTNKSYQELPCYLSSYINLLNNKLFYLTSGT